MNNTADLVRFGVLASVKKGSVFWNVMSCNLL
jgi:hypothetical protein